MTLHCTSGYYCPFNDTIKPCPRTTYNDEEGGKNLTDCDPCPPGYWCNEEGMAEFDVSPCPVGYYCTEATWEPSTCPPGTYRYRQHLQRDILSAFPRPQPFLLLKTIPSCTFFWNFYITLN